MQEPGITKYEVEGEGMVSEQRGGPFTLDTERQFVVEGGEEGGLWLQATLCTCGSERKRKLLLRTSRR